MRHVRVYGLVGLAIAAAAAVAIAQTTVAPLPEEAPVETMPLDGSAVTDLASTRWGDAQAGATLAGTCAACHGLDGNSAADPTLYPRIAGQPERYIAHQLALYKSGQRNTGMAAIMRPFASMLTAQDMRNLGAYYATQDSGAGIADDTLIAEGPNVGKRFYEVGEQLFRSGDAKRGIPACMACHGPSGAGNPGPAYPRLAGQHAWYGARRLQEYRENASPERQDDLLYTTMVTIASGLTDEEIESLGSYMQGLHDRSDDLLAAAGPAAGAPMPQPAPAPAAPPQEATPDAAAPDAAAPDAAAPDATPDAGAPAEEPAAGEAEAAPARTS